MKLVCIADTHGQHQKVTVPEGDVLICAGDVTADAGQKALRDFCVWFQGKPHKHKILIAGNHDWAFEKWPDLARKLVKDFAPGVHYLQDEGIEIDGIKFWGSPVQPFFFNWAFNRLPGAEILRHWDLIPADTDVLITHGPAFGRLDAVKPGVHGNKPGDRAGCQELRYTIDNRLKNLKAHIFGHLHYEGGSHYTDGNTTYANCAVVDEDYVVRPDRAIVIEIPDRAINFLAHEQTR